VIPTVIDLKRYGEQQGTASKQLFQDSRPRIVWIGSPSTVRYLQLLSEPLQALAKRHAFVLRVIGGGTVGIPGVQVESLPWSEDTEVKNISECAIGVMPLLDTSWERGKCGYKLIQYMACGLPVVASSVGVNMEIVRQGGNGFLADTPEEWCVALEKLLKEEGLRQSMGKAGRQLVEDFYCAQKTGPKISKLLTSLINIIDDY
jgi:glycosyltransferase involved in cell wall biosynthesis